MSEAMTGERRRLDARERVAVALDVETAAEAIVACDTLGNALGLAKVGSALFVREGMGLTGVWLGSTVDWLAQALLLGAVLAIGRWRTVRV